MEERVAKEAREARRRWLDSQDAKCQSQGCGQPKKWHSIWAHSQVRVTDHQFVKRNEDGNE